MLRNKAIVYKPYSVSELNKTRGVVFAVIDLALAMVRNGAEALPSKKFNKKTEKIEEKFQKIISTKDMILECLPSDKRRDIFNDAILNITVKNKQIQFVFNRNNIENQTEFLNDVEKIQKIMTDSNARFEKALPLAKKARANLIANLKTKKPLSSREMF